MKPHRIFILILFIIAPFFAIEGYAQVRKPINLPFADQKMYHLGFLLGIHGQDMILSHSGYVGSNGEAWFAEIPSYSVGFSVGIIGDRYINEYLNLRISPTFHFGEKKFEFKEQTTEEEYDFTIKNSYITIPLHLKFNAGRIKNYRPYILAGPYVAMDIASNKNEALRFKKMDYGLEFGLGCSFYLPMFKLSPELRFSFGLTDLINKDRSDLTDKDLVKYTEAISSGKSRMITLVFNFE
ncbi:MAG: porin family protein [Dysgonomonas sp.]|nr:porin family protein [Dysgonomonas sp.]